MAIYFENWTTELFVATSLIFGTIYVYVKFFIYTHWERRGIPFLQPSVPYGNFKDSVKQKLSIGEFFQKIYHQSNDIVIGIYALVRPVLVVRDPELIRAIFIKDFAHFADRGVYIDENYDPLSGHLFSLSGDKWRNLRQKLSPVFTSGKLKSMFSTLLNCGDSLKKYVNEKATHEGTIDAREIAARFTTDVIASVAFGLDIDSINNPDAPLRRYGRKIFEMNFKNGLRTFCIFVFPGLQKLLKLKFVDDDVEKFMMSVVKQTVGHREENNVVRKDLMQLLIQLRNMGKVQNDDDWQTIINKDENKKKLTFNELAAQVFLFFVAGFETSSSTTSFLLYEISKNLDIQKKIQKEIDDVCARYDGKITYESVGEMKYMEMCIDETLRIYPIVPILNRECTKEYKIPGSNIVIEKGTPIIIPVLGLQRDPKYYPNPDEFIPERFANTENDKTFAEKPYMPFGDGPRICIGLRLAKYQLKVALIMMLQNCNFELVPGTKENFRLSAKTLLALSAENGISLKVKKRII